MFAGKRKFQTKTIIIRLVFFDAEIYKSTSILAVPDQVQLTKPSLTRLDVLSNHIFSIFDAQIYKSTSILALPGQIQLETFQFWISESYLSPNELKNWMFESK